MTKAETANYTQKHVEEIRRRIRDGVNPWTAWNEVCPEKPLPEGRKSDKKDGRGV